MVSLTVLLLLSASLSALFSSLLTFVTVPERAAWETSWIKVWFETFGLKTTSLPIAKPFALCCIQAIRARFPRRTLTFCSMALCLSCGGSRASSVSFSGRPSLSVISTRFLLRSFRLRPRQIFRLMSFPFCFFTGLFPVCFSFADSYFFVS